MRTYVKIDFYINARRKSISEIKDFSKITILSANTSYIPTFFRLNIASRGYDIPYWCGLRLTGMVCLSYGILGSYHVNLFYVSIASTVVDHHIVVSCVCIYFLAKRLFVGVGPKYLFANLKNLT